MIALSQALRAGALTVDCGLRPARYDSVIQEMAPPRGIADFGKPPASNTRNLYDRQTVSDAQCEQGVSGADIERLCDAPGSPGLLSGWRPSRLLTVSPAMPASSLPVLGQVPQNVWCTT